jgi:membrane-bound metal-dependent hydrolase YbcI (DUF457 family)
MMGRTHVAIGAVGAAALMWGADPLATGIAVVASVAGSIMPDWDLYIPLLKHRTMTHNILVPVLLWFFLGMGNPIAIGVGAGWALHILADCLTVSGVPLLWPSTRLHIRGPLTTGGLGESLVLILFTGLCVYWRIL